MFLFFLFFFRQLVQTGHLVENRDAHQELERQLSEDANRRFLLSRCWRGSSWEETIIRIDEPKHEASCDAFNIHSFILSNSLLRVPVFT